MVEYKHARIALLLQRSTIFLSVISCFGLIVGCSATSAKRDSGEANDPVGPLGESRSSPDRFTKNLLTLIGLGESRENVIVKFIEGSMIRLRDGSLISIGDDDPTDLREVFDKHPLIAIERVFTRPE
jgi:hypothetical protein